MARYLLTGFDPVGSPVYEPLSPPAPPAITFTPQAQDHYTVEVWYDGFKVDGDRFHTRAEAEAYARAERAPGFTVRGTCPSYDRVAVDSRSAYTGRPYRQGDPIETDDIDPGFGDEF